MSFQILQQSAGRFSIRALLWCLVPLLFTTFRFPDDRDDSPDLTSVFDSSSFSSSIAFSFEEMGLEYRDMQAMTDDIRNMNSTGGEAHAAWKYLIENSFHYQSVTENDWLHHPEVFINSVGFGICGDQASVLAALWRAMGFEARIWDLNGEHVVAEVNDGSGWKIFDSDLGCFFTKKDNSIASYRDLASSAPLLFNSYRPKKTVMTLLEDGNCNPEFREAHANDVRRYYRAGKNGGRIKNSS